MATAEARSTGVVIALELSVEEAQYVHAALCKVDPKHLVEDTVFDVLGEAMASVGVVCVRDAADGLE